MSRLAFQYGTVHTEKSKHAFSIKRKFLKHHLSVILMAPIMTHQEDISKYDYLISKDENIYLTLKKQFLNTRLLIIDDAHLLSEVQVDELLQVAISLHISVLCLGLRTDFRTSGFSGARRLLELSQVLIESPSYCECGQKALFSVRKEKGKITFCGEKILKGDSICYEALCPACYYRKLIHYKRLKQSGRL